MGKLKGLHFNATIRIGSTGKLDNDSLVHLPNEKFNPANTLQLSCNPPANDLQSPCNYPADLSCNESEEEHINSDYEAYSNAYANKRIKDKRVVIIKKNINHSLSSSSLENLDSYYNRDKEAS